MLYVEGNAVLADEIVVSWQAMHEVKYLAT